MIYFLEWARYNIGKIVALTMSCFYLITAYYSGGGELLLRTLAFLIIPLGCIFFSAAMGGFTGLSGGGIHVSKPTPGCFIAFMGWIILFLPIIIFILQLCIN